MAETEELTLSSLSREDQAIVRKVLAGDAVCEPPFEGFSHEAATYITMVRYSMPAAHASEYVAIESGQSDGCDVIDNLVLVK